MTGAQVSAVRSNAQVGEKEQPVRTDPVAELQEDVGRCEAAGGSGVAFRHLLLNCVYATHTSFAHALTCVGSFVGHDV